MNKIIINIRKCNPNGYLTRGGFKATATYQAASGEKLTQGLWFGASPKEAANNAKAWMKQYQGCEIVVTGCGGRA